MPLLAKEHTPIPELDLLSWFFDDPQYDLDKPIYIDASNPSRWISGREGRSLICKVAAGLRKHGFQKGDCAVICSFNDIYYPIIALGIIAAGGTFSGTNPSYTPYEITHHFKTIHAKFVICEPDLLQTVLDANHVLSSAQHDIPRERIFVFDNIGQPIPAGFKGWKTLLEHGEVDWPRFTSPTESKTKNAMLMFSSGTTGLPKAVQLTHHNWIANHILLIENHPKTYDLRRLLVFPFFHVASTPQTMISPFREGVTTYVMRRFELEPYLQNIVKYSITDMVVVPPMAIAIIMSPLSKKYSLKSIRHGVVGAAPLGKEPQARLQALLHPDTPFTQIWGMTEVSCVGSFTPWPHHENTGSVGKFLNNVDVKLVDDNGKDITAGDTRGELCIRGPIVTRGYYENDEANKRDFDEDGFFHTGDIAYMDAKTEKWYIVDRKKELIKVRGFQVAPPELEAILLSHPSIVDAAVIGVPAPPPSASGELPRAFVVQRPDTAPLTEKEVVEWAGKRLAGYKRLDGGVRFVDSIPKNPSGKILKRVLREGLGRESKL